MNYEITDMINVTLDEAAKQIEKYEVSSIIDDTEENGW